MPPCDLWPLGRYDSVLFVHNSDNSALSPDVGLDGKFPDRHTCPSLIYFPGCSVAQIRAVFHPIWDAEVPNAPSYLVYAQRFDIIPQLTATPPTRASIPDLITGLYVFKRAFRADKSRIGGIIPLSHCRMPIQLVPQFGTKADS